MHVRRGPSMGTSSVYGVLVVILGVCQVLLFGSASAQIPKSGTQCPNKTASGPIDMKRITGHWYEIEATPTFMEYPFKCISIKVPTFYEKSTEISIEAINRVTKESEIVQTLEAKVPDGSNPKDGKLTLHMTAPLLTPIGDVMAGPYLKEHYQTFPLQILATDYSSWALVWSCKPQKKGKAHTELLWILSRQRTLAEEHYRAVREAKASHNVDNVKIRETIQTGCSKDSEERANKDDDDDDEEEEDD